MLLVLDKYFSILYYYNYNEKNYYLNVTFLFVRFLALYRKDYKRRRIQKKRLYDIDNFRLR